MSRILSLSQIVEIIDVSGIQRFEFARVAGVAASVFARFDRDPNISVQTSTLLRLMRALHTLMHERERALRKAIVKMEEALGESSAHYRLPASCFGSFSVNGEAGAHG